MALVAGSLTLSACQFDGIASLQLPGGKGTGDDATVITVDLPDVGTLTTNAQVKVDDIAVGTVTKLEVVDWHARATLSLEPGVTVARDAQARVGVNTLLGSAFVEIIDAGDGDGGARAGEPAAAPASQRLRSGDRIPLSRTRAYPSTEQVLSAASLALNGGGLEQISTITAELNRALGGNDRAVASLLPRLDSFVGALDDQREDILSTVRNVSVLAKRFAARRDVITGALDEVGPALDVLRRSRPRLTAALQQLTTLSSVATPLVEGVTDDLLTDLKGLVPALQAIRSAGSAAITGLGFLTTFPFAPETVLNACKADYCNLDLALDLTNSSILRGFVTPDGSIGIPGLPGLSGLNALLSGVTSSTGGGLLGLLGAGPAATAQPGRSGPRSSTPAPAAPQGLDLATPLGNLIAGLTGGQR